MNGWEIHYPYGSVPDYRGYHDPWQVHPQTTNQVEGNELMQELQGQINGLKAEQMATYNQMVTEYLRNKLNYRIHEIQNEISPERVLRHFSQQSND